MTRDWLLQGTRVTLNFSLGAAQVKYAGAAVRRKGYIYIRALKPQTAEEITVIIKEPGAAPIECVGAGHQRGVVHDARAVCNANPLVPQGTPGPAMKARLKEPALVSAFTLPACAIPGLLVAAEAEE